MNEGLARRVKAVTEETGMTFTQVVERGLCLFLAEQESSRPEGCYQAIPTSSNPARVPGPEELKELEEAEEIDRNRRLYELVREGRR